MKHLFVILFLFGAWVINPSLQAQIYTAPFDYSYSASRIATPPSTASFRSTSTYREYGTTMNNANPSVSIYRNTGSITTVASQIQGGMLTDGSDSNNGNMSYRPPQRVPGVPNLQPIGDGWDVAVFLLLLCVGYALYLTRKTRQEKAKA